jgi:hypothetical protein
VISSFSSLVEMVQLGTVPTWLREYVHQHPEEMTSALRDRGIFEFNEIVAAGFYSDAEFAKSPSAFWTASARDAQ